MEPYEQIQNVYPNKYAAAILRQRFSTTLNDYNGSDSLEDILKQMYFETYYFSSITIMRYIKTLWKKYRIEPMEVFMSNTQCNIICANLVKEYQRIQSLISSIDKSDPTKYLEKLKWNIDNPNGTEEERCAEVAEVNALLQGRKTRPRKKKSS